MDFEETEAGNDCAGEDQQPLTDRPEERDKYYERGEGTEDSSSLHLLASWVI
jgi:hypothetical protein